MRRFVIALLILAFVPRSASATDVAKVVTFNYGLRPGHE
jgi:hypothetical protein